MSSFTYGNINKNKVGVWLRYQSNPDLIKLIKNSKQLRLLDSVSRVIISEIDKETNEVWIEVWGKNLIDTIRGKTRYNVFSIKTKPNSEWICEGDLGKGSTM